MSETAPDPQNPSSPPPRAFTQGVGTVFQHAGVMMFLVLMTICCGSGLLSKETAQRHDLAEVGWHLASDEPGKPFYSAQRAISVSVFGGVALGMAAAGAGLGLQATRRYSAHGAVIVSGIGLLFWGFQVAFAVSVLRTVAFLTMSGVSLVVFGILAVLAAGALREMLRDPPPADHEVLPPGYKVPYSWYHDDPPDVRLAREVEDRRRRLEVEQKELEKLEKRVEKAVEERQREEKRR